MAITNRSDIINKSATKGIRTHLLTAAPGSNTAANAAAGHFRLTLNANGIGTTYPGTLQTLPLPNPGSELLLTQATGTQSAAAAVCFLARFYLMGTLNLAATGDQFTHDAATFPVTRTKFGAATKPVSLIPVIYITTATTTTAPVIRMRTAAGGTGYVDQDGNNVVGASTTTMPAAATAVQSGFIIRMEPGDSGVQDIVQIEVTTAGSAGAASIYGMEFLAPLSSPFSGSWIEYNPVFGGVALRDLKPAAATSGTATTFLGVVEFGNNSTVKHISICAVEND